MAGLNGDEPRTRRKIQSVERALMLLEILADSRDELRLNDISKAAGLNVSTCHTLLSTLVEHGYVSQSAQSRTYFLGNRILELSRSRIHQFDLAQAAMDDLRKLNERTGETVHLAVLRGDELVTIAVLDSRHPVRVASSLNGKTEAIHATATGKAILAWLPESEIERIIKRRGLPRFTDKTVVERDVLLEVLRNVRRDGFAVDMEEFQPGVVCIGAAIRDHMGAVIGSLSCSMPSMRADDDRIGEVVVDVKATAQAISVSLGGVAHHDTFGDSR